MPLSPGTRLGPYEVLAFIGAGGMGEVYKARDARLDRPVALKLLSSRPDGDLDLKHRFRREARAIAALTHPHICVLHDISEQDGTEFLVMEYLEGETLAQRLALGPLAVDQALRHAIEIASALDKAHGRGVVHRDLKPGNVMLTSGGAKLLDFGLAKLRPPAESGTGASPSVTGALSGEGKIVGTLNYMAPEQLQGRAVDARADIFAFGAVVYEMVTAQRAFDGSSHVSVIAEILERDPLPMTACQPLTPPMLDHVVRRCLAKDPEERWQSAHDVLVDLQWIAEGRSQMVGAGGRTTRGRPARRWVVLAGCALAAAAAGTLYARRARPSPAQSMQFSLIPPEGVTLTPGVPGLSVSPDGKWLAFAASDPSTPWPRWRLWLRRVDSLAAEPLPGTENATSPFWSPDSASIGFIAGDKLERLDLGGSPPRMLCG
ncbi:MAG TPA: protein kinase, partial [Vicinamibacteria bacterium]